MGNLVNVEKLNFIQNNYPETYEWMKHKARWEHMFLGKVLNDYENSIDEMIKKEIESKVQ